MNLLQKTSALIKSGTVVVAIAVAAINFSQTNNKSNFSSVAKIADADATVLCQGSSGFCSGSYTDSNGVVHYYTVSNSENAN